jgi:glycosyltransferase involved in cell wall biosynthesis
MPGLISFIIPVKNRDEKRIINCINSLKSDLTGEVIIVDYGSDIPVQISGVKIIRYDKNKVWNKSHAINLGIKEAKYNFIGTVDCDMIISEEFMEGVEWHLDYGTFIYSINVKRIEPRHVSGNFKGMLEHTSDWNNVKGRYNIIHNANGGIQIYPKKWISEIGGADESLIYWGGMDNDVFERAIVSGLTIINLNKVILHQEHEFKKEKNLDKKERVAAIMTKIPKIEYLSEMLSTRQVIRNDGQWGTEIPNQSRFLKSIEEIKAIEKKGKEDAKNYVKAFMEAVKEGRKTFTFNGKEVKTFR